MSASEQKEAQREMLGLLQHYAGAECQDLQERYLDAEGKPIGLDDSAHIHVDDPDDDLPRASKLPPPPELNQGDLPVPVPAPQSAPPPDYESTQKRKANPNVNAYARRVRKRFPHLGNQFSACMDLKESVDLFAQLNEPAKAALAAHMVEALFPKGVQYSAKALEVAEQVATQEAKTDKARECLKAAEKAVQDAKAHLSSETEWPCVKTVELNEAIEVGNDIKWLVELRETDEPPAACLAAWARDVVNKTTIKN